MSTTTTPLLRHNRWLPSSIKLKTTLFSELSGAVGDLGTYIPIVLALSLVNNLNLTTTLIFTSLYNIAIGLLFGLPVPVQPMKSIAAVAISASPPLTIAQISAAGLSVAAVLLVLEATGLMFVLYRYLPLLVVRGVQLSQGLSFAFSPPLFPRLESDTPLKEPNTPFLKYVNRSGTEYLSPGIEYATLFLPSMHCSSSSLALKHVHSSSILCFFIPSTCTTSFFVSIYNPTVVKA